MKMLHSKLDTDEPLKDLTKKLNISMIQVYHLWRTLKNTERDVIVELNNTLLDKIGFNDYLHKFFSQVRESSTLQTMTIKALYEQVLANCPYSIPSFFLPFTKSLRGSVLDTRTYITNQ